MAGERWGCFCQGLAEAIEVVMQWLPTGDHHKGSPLLLGSCCFGGQRLELKGRVGRLRPRVFGVAPAAAHRASAKANEEGAAAGM